jgi:hypothetical protein
VHAGSPATGRLSLFHAEADAKSDTKEARFGGAERAFTFSELQVASRAYTGTGSCIVQVFWLKRAMSNDQTTLAITTALSAAAAAVLLAIVVAVVAH